MRARIWIPALLKFLIAVAASAGLPSMAAAQTSPAALPDIFESYNDCFAVTASGIDASKLEARGWERAKVDGNPNTDPAFFGHGKRATLILLSGKGNKGVCVVVAKLENAAAFDELVSAWQGIKFDRKGEAKFLAEGHPVIITKTGSRDAPSVRLAVGPRVEN